MMSPITPKIAPPDGATAEKSTLSRNGQVATAPMLTNPAENTGLGAAIMFLGVAIVTPIFRWGVELTQGYYASYLGVTAIALVAVALLVICRDDENS